MTNKKIIIFDLDGTLLNTIEDITDSLNKALNDNDLPSYNIDDVKHFVGSGVNVLIEKALVKYPKANFTNIYDGYMKYYKENCKVKTKPYPDVIDTLKELKQLGYKLAVLSNKPQRDTLTTINYFFNDIFDFVCGAKESLNIKPSPDGIYEIISKFDLSIKEVIYVGDSDIDVLTAMNAKADFIICLYGFRTKDELKKYNIKHFAENIQEAKKIILSKT